MVVIGKSDEQGWRNVHVDTDRSGYDGVIRFSTLHPGKFEVYPSNSFSRRGIERAINELTVYQLYLATGQEGFVE